MPSVSTPRPHGPLRWILEKFTAVKSWSVVGCLSAEERCTSAIRELLLIDLSARAYCLKLMPHAMSADAVRITERIAEYETELKRIFGPRVQFSAAAPLHSTSHEVLVKIQAIVDAMAGSVVIDISTMPKRWFFPLVNELLASPRITDLIATNSKAAQYGEWLARDADQWEPLPGYVHLDDDAKSAIAIVGVGYHSLNIHELVGESRSFEISLKLMMPFPSLHPGFRKNWEFALSASCHFGWQVDVGLFSN